MAIANKYVIALEEHYYDAALVATYTTVLGGGSESEVRQRLDDVGELRLREMDEAGIDVQVLSHGAPSTQRLSGEQAVTIAHEVNDRLAGLVAAHPTRFAGFTALPTAEPAAAADELERTVTQLGFKGAMVHGLTNGVFFDDERFWPILERAEALDVPIYLLEFRELFAKHFWITTSGNFSTPALVCSMLEMGIDRILYSVDYPYVENPPGTEWMESLQVSSEDREKILSGNAKRLLRM